MQGTVLAGFICSKTIDKISECAKNVDCGISFYGNFIKCLTSQDDIISLNLSSVNNQRFSIISEIFQKSKKLKYNIKKIGCN